MNSGTRTRTTYGYEDKKYVNAQDGGMSVNVDYPHNAAGMDAELRVAAMLGGRTPFVGSRPDASMALDDKSSSYYTLYDLIKLTHPTSECKNYADGSLACGMQTVFDDLTGSQFGEDQDKDVLLLNEGGTDWEFTVSFRGRYNPLGEVLKRKSTQFPQVYITFVTPNDNGMEALGIILIIVGVLGGFCLVVVVVNDPDGDDYTCCGFCGDETESTGRNSSNNFGSRFVPPSAPAASSGVRIDTSGYSYTTRFSMAKFTNGLGTRVLTKRGGDHVTIPMGKYYTAVVVPNNDVRSLQGRDSYASDQSIKHINVDNNDVDSLRGIERYHSLETLICTSNNLRTLDTNHRPANNLRILDVGNNDIRMLFSHHMIIQFPNLAAFDGVNNDVDDISGLAANCPRLEALNLQNNSLGQKSASIFNELAKMKCLTHVNLANNDIKPRGNDIIEFATTCSANLKYLNLQQNDIPKSKLRQMRDILSRRGLHMFLLADDGNAPIVGQSATNVANPMGSAQPMVPVGVTVNAVAFVDPNKRTRKSL